MAPLPAPMQPTYQKAVADLEALQKYEDALVRNSAALFFLLFIM